MESILTSIKKLLGIAEEYTHFDNDLIVHINSVFLILTQLGVGPATGFMIEDKYAEWEEFIDSSTLLQSVKSFMYLKVKLLFDPPLSSTALQSMTNIVNEFEWRIRLAVEQMDTE